VRPLAGMAIDPERIARACALRERQGLSHLLTTEETAARLGVSESYLKKGRLTGRSDLPQALSVGPRVYYRLADVERWARDRAQGLAYRPPARRTATG